MNVIILFGYLKVMRSKIVELETEKLLAESERDSLLMAIAGTHEGRQLDISNPHDVIQAAVIVIRQMDAENFANRITTEIPFGAVEQDRETMKLERRIAELELQLELKVDEQNKAERRWREIKNKWFSLMYLLHGEKQ